MNSPLFLLTSSLFLIAFPAHALTRAEIIERFRAVPVMKLDGLVQVVADCPADMRRRYQLDIAANAAEACRLLYAAETAKPRRFQEPGIVIHIGDGTNAVTNVVSRVRERAGDVRYTSIYLPSPGHANQRALATEIAKAFFLAVHGRTVDDRQAWHALMSADPVLRATESCRQLANWSERGLYEEGMSDEDYLKLARKVLLPGQLTPRELDGFASRLYLYPLSHDVPFCGRHTSLDFRSAVLLRDRDPCIRLAAFIKARQVLIFGAGRGEGLQSAADAYAEFLTELGRSEKTEAELLALLASADEKLCACASRPGEP